MVGGWGKYKQSSVAFAFSVVKRRWIEKNVRLARKWLAGKGGSIYSGAAVRVFPNLTCDGSDEMAEALADPDSAVPGGIRPRLYHGERGQRSQRHLDLFGCRGAVRPFAAVDYYSHDFHADCGAGNVGPHGRGDGQRAQRPDPRRIRARHHVRDDAGPGGGE